MDLNLFFMHQWLMTNQHLLLSLEGAPTYAPLLPTTHNDMGNIGKAAAQPDNPQSASSAHHL